MADPRKYEVVLFGATSSVGVAVAQYMATKARVKWAIAGRRQQAVEKIADMVAAMGETAPDVLIADVENGESLRAMCKQTNTLLTTVGPYAQFGEPVIEACIATRTHYVDITGEAPWVDTMKKKHGAAAAAAKVHILSFCGYDSIPSELGVYLCSQALKEEGQLELVESFHLISGGGLPDGTVETILHGVAKAKASLCKRKPVREAPDWQANEGLVPKAEQRALKVSLLAAGNFLSWSPQAQCITPPHFMAMVNTPVVHGSAAALGYGGLLYKERLIATGLSTFQSKWSVYGLLPSLGTLLSLLFLAIAAVLGFLRPLAKVLNAHSRRQKPLTKVVLMARTKGSQGRCTAEVCYPGDPGIVFTAVLCVQVALACVKGEGQPPSGFNTPVVAFRDDLTNRLRDAGVTIKVQKLAGR